MTVEFRIVGLEDELLVADLFADLDQSWFSLYPFTSAEAHRVATYVGRDVYAILVDALRPIAYGMLRGWDEGYVTPSLGIAVRRDAQGRGHGRSMMHFLHAAARRRGASRVRLRVHPDNHRARRLYESLSYVYDGEDRGELVMIRDLDGSDDVIGDRDAHG